MGLYTFEIDLQSQNILYIISTSFGLYRYKRLPMGITNITDSIQSIMYLLFGPLDWREIGSQSTPSKCEWDTSFTEYLDFLLTTHGITQQLQL